jgi:hypothetical protein
MKNKLLITTFTALLLWNATSEAQTVDRYGTSNSTTVLMLESESIADSDIQNAVVFKEWYNATERDELNCYKQAALFNRLAVDVDLETHYFCVLANDVGAYVKW